MEGMVAMGVVPVVGDSVIVPYGREGAQAP
jgi:hypothetical protein